MTTEITITAEQIEQMKNRMRKMENQSSRFKGVGNSQMENYYEGQAIGIAYVLAVMGIEY